MGSRAFVAKSYCLVAEHLICTIKKKIKVVVQ